MARALLVLALALVLVMPGCLNSETIDSLWTDLEAKPEYEERSLFNDQVEFSPTGVADPENPPSGPEDLGDEWSTNVTVPQGTRLLTVLFDINFSTSDLPDAPTPVPVPLPADVPDGQVDIFVEGAGNESRNITFREATQGGFDFTGPSPGAWTIGFSALGQGDVQFRVIGEVPIAEDG